MKNYFDFKGVAKRQEYWAVIVASFVGFMIGIVITESIPLVALVVLVAALWVYLATTVRRLRDAGSKSCMDLDSIFALRFACCYYRIRCCSQRRSDGRIIWSQLQLVLSCF